MDVNIIHSRTTIQSNTDALGMTILKKTIEVESQPALQLIAESTGNQPNHLGRNIDTMA